MTTQVDKTLESLAESLQRYRELDGTPERHAYLLWLITKGMTLLGAGRPILVGGAAVELYTSVRFVTDDLDLVAPDKEACLKVLEALGFEQPDNGNHFVNRGIAALVELHGGVLYQGEESIELVYRKVPLLVVSPEDCITERLASYRRHSASLDLVSAFLIMYHHRERLDVEHLQTRVGALDVWDLYSAIQSIGRTIVLNESGPDEVAGALIQILKKGPSSCAF